MAWDARQSRRRQSSAASRTHSLALHARQQLPKQPIEPKSQHVADPFLRDFLSPVFDPVAYLNATLPSLQITTPISTSSASTSTRTSTATTTTLSGSQAAVPLAELSVQAQSVLTQLNAHTTRLTNTLTELTNDILRSGARLAYEVELLRGETIGLAEALTERLDDDIGKFVPGGVRETIESKTFTSSDGANHGLSAHQRRLSIAVHGTVPPAAEESTAAATTAPAEPPAPPEPECITQLRTLTLVRSRLESVIKTFGEAMEFVFPPSEVSVSSGFLSVSAPDAGGEGNSTEEKGQQVLRSLRDEISRLLGSSGDGKSPEEVIKGIEDAAHRVEELKKLVTVWKGTAEEKGRTKFVDSLAKMVEDRHKELLKEMEQANKNKAAAEAADAAAKKNAEGESQSQTENKGFGAYGGLISQLQRLRTGL
ncbi:uncharacterized protein CTHT_0005740 [Thermochaetoides thermophila DSM 1495]|uniref:Uncharacterized protein n=1 Tax=Chaetomium thermophilum (strain DSM 1495 / CBS 144.50 / IMI 039719) TaxID=759272 RepID=G0RY80_CHATD|nr:hypothetical protein CTHT_0005740 [Thermochaetoides thermophila DSM 1495]EGS23866.1 hypothetical protein CTHT_0005740 [Thermochaetoides thermophila DSM 1495]